jgi:hypothetical protein
MCGLWSSCCNREIGSCTNFYMIGPRSPCNTLAQLGLEVISILLQAIKHTAQGLQGKPLAMMRRALCRRCSQLVGPAPRGALITPSVDIRSSLTCTPSSSSLRRSIHLSTKVRDSKIEDEAQSKLRETTNSRSDAPARTQTPIDDTPSKALVLLTASLSKLFCKLGCSSFEVDGIERLVKIVTDEARQKEGRGLITFANHISVFVIDLSCSIWMMLTLPACS